MINLVNDPLCTPRRSTIRVDARRASPILRMFVFFCAGSLRSSVLATVYSLFILSTLDMCHQPELGLETYNISLSERHSIHSPVLIFTENVIPQIGTLIPSTVKIGASTCLPAYLT